MAEGGQTTSFKTMKTSGGKKDVPTGISDTQHITHTVIGDPTPPDLHRQKDQEHESET